jgi:capsule polysaccharide export protein KpsC/LpsZ
MLSLTDQQNIILDDYMIKRYCNNQSMDISFATKPENAKRARKRLNINNNFLTVCLFTHLLWDALYESTSMIFDDADQWVIESMYKMIEIKDVNWIIKIHPAEHIHKSAYSVADTIKKEFPVLPGHIKVVWSDSETNTMSILNMIDVGITIMGTVGLELPLLGKPIIIAGKSHLSNKGFTIDSSTKEEYFNNLSKAKNLKRLTADQINLARLYAYSYFIQQQVPLNVIDKKKGHWGGMDMNKYEELLPGINLIMDEICHSIINGKNVILTEETLRSINYGR